MINKKRFSPSLLLIVSILFVIGAVTIFLINFQQISLALKLGGSASASDSISSLSVAQIIATNPFVQPCSTNCSSLPVPVFKICPNSNPQCSPKKHYTVEFFVDNKPLVSFASPLSISEAFTDWTGSPGFTFSPNYTLSLVNGAGVVSFQGAGYTFSGTNKFIVYQDDYTDQKQKMFLWIQSHDIKIYNGANKTVRFTTDVLRNSDGTIVLVKDSSMGITSNDILQVTKKVTSIVDNLLQKKHINYTLYVIPQLLSNVGSDLYLGNSKLAIGMQPDTKAATISLVGAEMAHEYSHAMQFERAGYGPANLTATSGATGNYSAFIEGEADSVAVQLNYKLPENAFHLSKESTDCVNDFTDPHDIGRCIFGKIYTAGLFSTSFFQKLFTLNKVYDFGDSASNNTQYCSAFDGILSYATGKDMTQMLIQSGCNVLSSQISH